MNSGVAVPMATVTSVSNLSTVTASPVASPMATLKAAVAFEPEAKAEAKAAKAEKIESPKARAALAWDAPYPARASPRSPGRGPRTPQRQRSESQKRCQDLYEDHEIRLRKWQAKVHEKAKKEEDEIQKNIANTCSPRNFNEHAFQNWFEA